MKPQRATAIALLLTLCACSGGGTGPAPAAYAPAAIPTATAPHTVALATATIVITVPASTSAQATRRRPAYVSPATKSIAIAIYDASHTLVKTANQDIVTGAPGCTTVTSISPMTCDVTFTVASGSYTFDLITYDKTGEAGNRLSQTLGFPFTVVGGPNTIPVVLGGLPATFHVAPVPPSSSIVGDSSGLQFVWGTSSSVLVTTLDADNNFIVGPGEPALALSVNGPTAGSGIAIVPASDGNPHEFVVHSTGHGSATLAIKATPTSGSSTTWSVPLAATTRVTTVAGTPGGGAAVDGTGPAAQLAQTLGLAYDPVDGNVYFTDSVACTIRKMTPSYAVTTIAGHPGTCTFNSSGSVPYAPIDGTGAGAYFLAPKGIVFDPLDGDLYVADGGSVRRVTPGGVVTTLDPSGHFDFDQAYGIAYDSADGNFYVTDSLDIPAATAEYNCAVRRVTPGGAVMTIAGPSALSSQGSKTPCGNADGTGSGAMFGRPTGIAFYPADANLYLADELNDTIRRVTPAGVVTTVAGTTPAPHTGCPTSYDGAGTAAGFCLPTGIVYNADDGNLYIADSAYCAIRQMTPNFVVTTVSGRLYTNGFSDGIGTAAFFEFPSAITYATGQLYTVDSTTIRLVQL